MAFTPPLDLVTMILGFYRRRIPVDAPRRKGIGRNPGSSQGLKLMTVYRRIETSQVRGITVVTFIERKILEAAHILELGEELLQLVEKDGSKDLLLDFSSVEFLSSAALNKLIILDKKVKSKSGQLKLCNMMPEIREVFVITRLNQLFDIVDTREKAMDGFQRSNQGVA